MPVTGRVVPMAAPWALAFLFVYFQRSPLSGERDFSQLLTSGPFKGVRTDEAHRLVIEETDRGLEPHENATGKVIFYPMFAAGYLMTTMKPVAEMLYQSDIDFGDPTTYRYVKGLADDSVAMRVMLPFMGSVW